MCVCGRACVCVCCVVCVRVPRMRAKRPGAAADCDPHAAPGRVVAVAGLGSPAPPPPPHTHTAHARRRGGGAWCGGRRGGGADERCAAGGRWMSASGPGHGSPAAASRLSGAAGGPDRGPELGGAGELNQTRAGWTGQGGA